MAYGVTEDQFKDWLMAAKPDSTIEYHRGALSRDCADKNLTVSGPEAVLRKLRRAVLAAHDAGLVTLLQRRRGYMDTSYIAMRRNTNV